MDVLPPDPLRLPLQEGPNGASDSPVLPETLGESDMCQPHALTPIPEQRCASASASANASESKVPSSHARPLHVQFDAQSPAALVSPSGSNSSSSDDEELFIAEARPPDGGWGWVIVFAAFMVNVIADGITVSFGVFFPHFLEYFGEGKGKTAWIAGIFMAMPLLSGPIASFLTDRYGCRRTTICGSILAAIGFLISSFVDKMETLFFTFGIIAGFGLSLCYVAPVVIVAYYFEKKRSLATGISVCGSGIGTFILVPLTYEWLDKYGWRGTTLILAGLFLNIAVCGLLFRDLPWTATMNKEKAKERKRRRERKGNKRFVSPVDSLTDSKSSVVGPIKVTDAVDIETITKSIIVPQYSSLVDLPTYKTGGEGVYLESFELTSTHNSVPSASDTNGTRQFSDKAALPVQWVVDFSYFLNPAFLVFVVSNFLLYMWYDVPYVYIVGSGLDMGLGMSQASWLTSIIGILTMFGEIILGWVGDWECVNPSLVYAVCMVFCGLVTFIMPLLPSYLGLAAASGAFGFFIAANYSLTSKILVKQITLHNFTNAYGFLLFIQGLANLIGPQLAGWVFNITNNYHLSFYLAGVFIGISGLIIIVYNATHRYNNYRKRKSGQVHEQQSDA